MFDYGTLAAVVIGGLIALGGTLLSSCLQNRADEKKRKRERKQQRYDEIIRYLKVCLDFADRVSMPTAIAPLSWDTDSKDQWRDIMIEHENEWKTLSAAGSGRILLTKDADINKYLVEVDMIRIWFYIRYRNIASGKNMPCSDECDNKRDELMKVSSLIVEKLDTSLTKND